MIFYQPKGDACPENENSQSTTSDGPPKAEKNSDTTTSADTSNEKSPPSNENGYSRLSEAEINELIRDSADPETVSEESQVLLQMMSQVNAKPVQWLWPGRIPLGKLSVIFGDPGLGKSTVMIDIASRVSRGANWPDGQKAPEGRVILITAEDSLEDTVRPRLDAHHANCTKVLVWRDTRIGADVREMSLIHDLKLLDDALAKMQDVRLIVIDPLTAYLEDTDSHKDSSVRSLLRPLAALAEKYAVAIVAVMHMNKADGQKALYRATGSVGFGAAARSVFAIGQDPNDTERRIMVGVKSNLARMPKALAFHIEPLQDHAKVKWEEQAFDIDPGVVLGGAVESEKDLGVDEWLTEFLSDGPKPSKDVFEEGKENGFSEITLNRAKARLGFDAIRINESGSKWGKWWWSDPGRTEKPVKGTVSPEVIPLIENPQNPDLIPLIQPIDINEDRPKPPIKGIKGITFGDTGIPTPSPEDVTPLIDEPINETFSSDTTDSRIMEDGLPDSVETGPSLEDVTDYLRRKFGQEWLDAE